MFATDWQLENVEHASKWFDARSDQRERQAEDSEKRRCVGWRGCPQQRPAIASAAFKNSLVHAGSADSPADRLVQFLNFFPCREDIEVFTEFGAFNNTAAQVV